MTGASTSEASGGKAPRGRIDKRQAILEAAFTVFAREGYANACVKQIAAEANVAKPTVYNHLNDKANLFRQAIEVVAEKAMAENLAVMERLASPKPDLRAALEDVGHRFLLCYSSDESTALRRLAYAEVSRFPELMGAVRGGGTNRVTEALADRLARLTLDGRLGANDPALAAEQFIALLTGPMETRSGFGTTKVPDDELRSLARAAVHTFLQAFGTADIDITVPAPSF
ncbi:TetR/AcrR family transcriptional regulator [Streptomyces sp. NPDC059743]|uniref:TetR/AcrR family transcriptional regulator n=1 Tax=Streptomyces sp. NPDC059743 TaxID=3346928 RepID=UPI00365D567D